MLALAKTGFRRSVGSHNCDLVVVCDWIEASLLDNEDEVYRAQIVDILHEQVIYDKDGSGETQMCGEFMDMIWSEMQRRQRLLRNACPYQVESKKITRISSWEDHAASAYLTTLSCLEHYPDQLQNGTFANQYGEQGSLFEDFCCEVLNLKGWQTQRTGWSSRPGQAAKLVASVQTAAKALGEMDVNEGHVKRFKHKNEAGCDLVGCLSYPDGRTGRPVILLQCASGADYQDKLSTPSIELWQKFIAFSTVPLRGFCTPRSFDNDSFAQHSSTVNGIFLDRCRLLQPLSECDKLSNQLRRNLIKWSRPRIKAMPVLT